MTHMPTGLTEVIHEPGPDGLYFDEVKAAHVRLQNRLRSGEHKRGT